jgi:hypothetical protein
MYVQRTSAKVGDDGIGVLTIKAMEIQSSDGQCGSFNGGQSK